jgi:hypothetical protein
MSSSIKVGKQIERIPSQKGVNTKNEENEGTQVDSSSKSTSEP